MVTAVLVVAHLLVAAIWFGAMGYSLGVVQPRARAFFADRPAVYEELATTLAAGARWKVVGVLAVLAATGAGLVLTTDPVARTGWWWALVTAKIALLAAASGVFWYVSWRMWPRRIFALPAERDGHQQAFLRVGWTLASLAGSATVLGALTAVIATRAR
jgi:hypothetical protein